LTEITQLSNDGFQTLRQRNHPHCVVCGQQNESGLRLDFRLLRSGVVEAVFSCRQVFEGYPNMLHGGVICALLDGAMANCLFAHGMPAVTADLNVRFRDPVASEGSAVVRAWLESCVRPLHKARAELVQNGKSRVTARGKFIERAARRMWAKDDEGS
jgi:acyl-coenzyme A thioesterase PaaI-like protein